MTIFSLAGLMKIKHRAQHGRAVSYRHFTTAAVALKLCAMGHLRAGQDKHSNMLRRRPAALQAGSSPTVLYAGDWAHLLLFSMASSTCRCCCCRKSGPT